MNLYPEYPSRAQQLPTREKPVFPITLVILPSHLGQTSRGSSEYFCSTSVSSGQSHLYSYIGICYTIRSLYRGERNNHKTRLTTWTETLYPDWWLPATAWLTKRSAVVTRAIRLSNPSSLYGLYYNSDQESCQEKRFAHRVSAARDRAIRPNSPRASLCG